MPDLYTWIAFAVGVLALIVGAQFVGVGMALLILVAALVLLTSAGMAAGRRTRRHLASRDPRFKATDEVFRDPASGDMVRVHVDPETGERRYWNT